MKNNKILGFIVIICLLFVSGIIGFFLGNNINNKNINNETSLQEVVVEEKHPEESLNIAIVNLDEGINVNGEIVYYAEKMITFPDTTFKYASLTEAKDGINSGLYGGYIIIPTNFSANVVSLNNTPQISKLDYTINSSLTGQSQYEILYDILVFGESLNSHISYMYVDNILTEFHTGQDYANIVMANDIRDKEAIDARKDMDLIAMVEIPELVHTDPNIEQLNIDIYTQSNNAAADDINKVSIDNIDTIKKDVASLNENGKKLSDVIQKLSEEAGEIDVFKNEKGVFVKDSAEEKLNSILDDIYDNEYNNIQWTEDSFEALSTQTDAIMETLQGEVDDFNINQAEELKSILELYYTNMNIQVPEMVCINEDGAYIFTFASSEPEDETVDAGETENADNNENTDEIENIPVLKIYITDDEQDANKVEARREILARFMEKLSMYDGNGTLIEIKSFNLIVEECDNDSEIRSLLEKINMSGMSEFIDTFTTESSIEMLTYKQNIVIEGDVSEFRKYIIKKMENVSNDYTLEPAKMTETYNLLEALKDDSEKKKVEVQEFSLINEDSIKSVFDNDYVTVIENNLNQINNNNKNRYKKETEKILAYTNELDDFNPVFNGSFIMDKVAVINDNNSKIMDAVTTNNTMYVEYANQVYDDATNNINNLKNSILEADKKSAESVTSALAEAKTVKEETSLENQELMLEFTGLLPYTRLGSVEYTQAYEMIVDPIILFEDEYIVNNTSNNANSIDNVETNNISQSVKSQKSFNIILFIIGSVLLFIMLICVVVMIVKKHKHTWD